MIIKNNNTTDNFPDKMQKCLDYIQSLEEERRKIQVFQRELPLCLHLVSEAIEKCKKEFCNREQSECSEQTSTDGPILEEFMPIKRASSSELEENEQQSKKAKNFNTTNNQSTEKSSKKSDWLRSVQLWNQTPDLLAKEESSPRKVSVVEVNKNGNGGAFHPFKREEKRMVVEAAAASSTAETGGSSGGKGEDKEDSQRKARRCWSPELHRRFLQALQQLGGAHVATPKQIRELMKVDGLTNDEVKSHLQKYRLHTRRPSPSVPNNHPQAPQFVVVGGIWVPPPPDYTSTAAASGDAARMRSSPPSGIYAPKATLAKSFKEEATKKQREESETNYSDKNGSYSKTTTPNSPSTSSSTHTTIASPAF